MHDTGLKTPEFKQLSRPQLFEHNGALHIFGQYVAMLGKIQKSDVRAVPHSAG